MPTVLPTAYITAYLITAYCLSNAYCTLPTAYTARCLLPTAYCLLPTAYILMHAYLYCLYSTAYTASSSCLGASCLLPATVLYSNAYCTAFAYRACSTAPPGTAYCLYTPNPRPRPNNAVAMLGRVPPKGLIFQTSPKKRQNRDNFFY